MNTRVVTLQPDIFAQIERITKHERTSTEEFVNQAVRDYLQRLEDQALEKEIRAFERLHPQLVEAYLGQFVAIHRGELVDADPDFEALFLRIQERFGDAVVLIRQVSAEPTLKLRGPTPRAAEPGRHPGPAAGLAATPARRHRRGAGA